MLLSCSGGDTGSEPECGPISSCPLPRLNPEESIVGLWDRSGVQDSQQEILYTFIGADVEYLVYDYEQDNFGSGENCHTLDVGLIYRNTESSTYQIEFQAIESDAVGSSVSSSEIFREGNNLDVSFQSFPESGIEEMWAPVNDLTTDDLALCQ